jgi:hypothetical protein
MATQTISGARAKLYIGDTEVGYATNCNGSETQSLQRIDVLGDAYSKEIVPMRRMVQFTAAIVRIKRGSAKALGLMARGDTAAILNFPPLDAVLFDPITDEAMETITGCVIEQRGWSVDGAGVLSENVSFQGIRMKDEDEA